MADQFEHYYTENPKCKETRYTLSCKAFGKNIILETASGIYSPRNIDKGSLIHLKHVVINKKDKVLDLGCGYGTVGIFVKKLYPSTEVVMSDINKRAVNYAKRNIKKNNIQAKVIQSDGFKKIKDSDFDVILFNPPINAGLKVCYRLIASSFEHLKKGGSLQVVLRPRGGGERLVKKIKSVFGNAEKVAKEDIYEIYIAKKTQEVPESEYDKKMFLKKKKKI